MKFVLIDDVQAHNDILADKLLRLCRQRGWNGQIALKTTSTSEVLDYARQCTEPTVYFLDIVLSTTEDTLSLFRSIQAQAHESYLIYVSAHTQYAMDCLHTHAFDFLLKPLTDEQLADCMSAVMLAHSRRCSDQTLIISMGSRLLSIRQSDILYFVRERMNVRACCRDGTSYVWRESFDHLLPRLDAAAFFQIHRSCIVNLRGIAEVHWADDRLILRDGRELIISRRRSAAFKAALQTLEGKTL